MILNKIRQNDPVFIARTYNNLRSEFVAYSRRKYNLDEETILDLYHESFYILYKKVRHHQLTELTCSLKTYLFSIGSNLILNELRRRKKLTPDIENHLTSIISENLNIEFEEEQTKRISILKHSLEILSETCKKIIELFYWQKLSLTEILFKMTDYNTINALKTQKYKCMRKLEKLTKEKFVTAGLY